MAIDEQRTALPDSVEAPAGTLERGLAILELLASAPQITAGQIAEALRLSRSATYRILGTLRAHGYLEWTEGAERVGLGFRAIALGMAALNSLDVVTVARAHLHDLSVRLTEAVMLAMRDGDEMVYVVHEDSRNHHSIAMRPLLGARRHMHSTSLGKAYLAALPLTELDALLERLPLPRFTETTITDVAQLRRELDAIRLQNYSIDDAENEPGVICYGAAVRDHRGRPTCAISVAGPTERMRGRAGEIGPLVAQTALAISRRLGYLGTATGISSATER
jgi:DNA-binding IclR family transcriptional regulator